MPFRGFLLFATPRKPCLRTVLSGRILQGLPSSPGRCKKPLGPQGQRSNIWALDQLLKLPDQEKSPRVFELFAHKVSVIPVVSVEPGGEAVEGPCWPHLTDTQPLSGHLPWKRWSREPRESPRTPPGCPSQREVGSAPAMSHLVPSRALAWSHSREGLAPAPPTLPPTPPPGLLPIELP